MFGDFLGSIVRIANVPIRATETLLGAEDEDDRILSKPGDIIAEELEKIDED